jgi:hypothetical protein
MKEYTKMKMGKGTFFSSVEIPFPPVETGESQEPFWIADTRSALHTSVSSVTY